MAGYMTAHLECDIEVELSVPSQGRQGDGGETGFVELPFDGVHEVAFKALAHNDHRVEHFGVWE